MPKTKLPKQLIWIVIAICILPFILNLLGISFKTYSQNFNPMDSIQWNADFLADARHKALSGSFIHTFLEWSAVAIAILTGILAFVNYGITGEITTPIVGTALFCAGVMDGFHIFAADRLIQAATDNQTLIPFTWAISRLFNALVMIAGTSIFLFIKPFKKQKRHTSFVVLSSLAFGTIAYTVITICIHSKYLPATIFPNAIISRPWDILPLILFIVAGIFIYPRFYKRYPSLFSHALIISVFPNVAAQAYMAFGSAALFDNHFNIGHFLKIIAYAVPLTGLMLDYIQTYWDIEKINFTLAEEISERKQIEIQLRQAHDEMEMRVKERTKDISQANEQLRTEITERQRVQEKLQTATQIAEESRAYMKAIVDNLADGLLATDVEGKITQFNPALLTMFGIEQTNLKGQRCNELFNNEIADLLQKTRGIPEEFFTSEILLKNERIGKAVATAISKNHYDDTVEQLIGSVVLIRDITKEKEIDGMKTDFISTVSHELRTPLTSIMGFAKLINKKLKDNLFPLINSEDKKVGKAMEQVRSNIEIILSESERLSSLIKDILDIAKMEAGKVEWQMQPLAIEEVINQSLAATASLFEDKKAQLVKDIAPGLPAVLGDRDRLIQVIINLISNAIKFTDVGTITCQAKQQGNEIIVSIIDTGIGIAPADCPKVFEKFKQVGDTLTDKPKGTGLGLPICKQIVEHHGGRIWVESNIGQGSRFSFSLPLSPNISSDESRINVDTLVRQLKETIIQNDVNSSKSRKIIMVVDDDANIRELLRQELEAKGYEVKEAENGVDAITQIKDSKPDLVLLDIMMPQINGFDVAAVLKNDPTTKDIPIIIVSIFGDKERGLCLGIDRYFTKPLNTEGLLKDIVFLTEERQ